MRGGLFLRFLKAVERCDAGESSLAAPKVASLKRKALFSDDDGEKDLVQDLTFVLNNIQVWNGNKYDSLNEIN